MTGTAILAGLQLPEGVAQAEIIDQGQPVPLAPEDATHVAGAVEKRRHDFALGRACARAALENFGTPTHVGRAANGAPLWPEGIAGSITHTRGYAAAIVAPSTAFRGLGLDAERVGGVTPALFSRLFVEEECAYLESRSEADRAIAATLLFSAKEAFYKAFHPMLHVMIGFQDVRIELGDGGFAATWAQAARSCEGCFTIAGDLVVTAICLPF